jgi:SAM-dependent methyltransferase
VSIASRFDRVIATDRSRDQLHHAIRAANVEYRHAAAEQSGLADGTVDLVTAAQALHWFDIPAFFTEAHRVLAADGAIAVWGYGDPELADHALQTTLHEFNRGLLEPYWPAERSLLLAEYATIEFPFDEIVMPRFEMSEHWTLPQLTGYLRSWSAVGRYQARHGRDPVSEVEKALLERWGDPGFPHILSWPLHVRAGRPFA